MGKGGVRRSKQKSQERRQHRSKDTGVSQKKGHKKHNLIGWEGNTLCRRKGQERKKRHQDSAKSGEHVTTAASWDTELWRQ